MLMLSQSTSYAWDNPNEFGGGGGASYYDIDYGFSPLQYEAFMFQNTLYLFEYGLIRDNWPDFEDSFGDIIPRQDFLSLILQCAGTGSYTCSDFSRIVSKCNTGQYINYNCIDLVERTNLINAAARQAIVQGCQTIGVCTTPPPPLTFVWKNRHKAV